MFIFRFREWNIKWRVMIYFFLFSVIAALCLLFSFDLFYVNPLTKEEKWVWALVLILVGQVIGYMTAKYIQRGIDALYLAMLEVSKGNFKARVNNESVHSFQYLYDTFNSMTSMLEERITLLQKLGQEKAQVEQEIINTAVVEERKRLARDLHDTVSQELFAIHMAASTLPKMQESNPQAVPALMQQMIKLSHHAQKQMRGLISQLRPIELNNHTLEEALDKWFPEYCRANELTGVLDVQVEGDIPDVIEHQLFLMIQEAMANVVKHASATRIVLTLKELDNQFIMQIEDNGKGFDRSDISSASHGLSTMRERSQQLGGETQITSQLEVGTKVRVTIPKLDQLEEESERKDNDE